MNPTRAEAVAARAGRALQALLTWSLVSVPLLFVAPHAVRAVDGVLRVLNVPVAPTAFSVVLLAVVTGGFLRRKRAALWFVVVVWQAPAVVLPWLLRRDDPVGPALVGSAVGVAVSVALVLARGAFPARLARGSWWRAGVVLLGGIALAAAVSHGIRELLPDGMRHVREDGLPATARLLATHPDGLAALTRTGPLWLAELGSALAAGALLAAVWVFLRSAPHDPAPTLDDELAVRRLLAAPTNPGAPEVADSLGYFATRDDRAVVRDASDRAAVSYRVVAGVCLAAGDPLGEPAAWPAAIATWLTHARTNGWVPAVVSASERGARAYEDAGLRALSLGDEAVLHPATFDLGGPAMRAARRAVEHARRAGYRVLVRRQGEVDADELARVAAAADAWRDGPVERGFSMSLGRLGDPRDARSVLVTAHDADGELRGLLSFVPWGRRGLSLDVMRRSPAAVGGVTELMVAELMAAGAHHGTERVSLNFAVFRDALEQGARLGATPLERFNRAAVLVASRRFQLDSLYRANEKYLPDWVSRYVCFENPGQLTQVSLAAAQAEGFLAPPPGLERVAQRVARGRVRRAPAVTDARVAAVLALEADLAARRAAPGALPDRRLTDQEAARHAKLTVLRRAGLDPYPASVPRTHPVPDVLTGTASGVLSPGTRVSVTGRVVRVRDHGGVLFAVLREDAAEVQVMLTADRPAARPDLWRATVDLADHVSVTGEVTRSRTGETSVHASSWVMAAKALRPPPDKRAGLADPEARVRRRHVALALDDGAARDLRARSRAVRALRDALDERGFCEVETPVLQRTHGGANARPFVTHINAYDTDLSLRIAPELYLKRLCVGGVGKVFEIGRNFRNEGADATHNPEFTSLEAYEAHGDYTTMRSLARDLVVAAAVRVHGEPVARRAGGDLRLDGEWPVVTVHDAVSRATGTRVTPDTGADALRALCAAHGVHAAPAATAGALVTELYETLVEPVTVEPTFYTDFPVETSPLTRAHRTDPRLAERWDLVACGMELGTAYTELADPLDQRDRLTRQSLLAAGGDPEAMQVDEEFLEALEFGMPPTGGLGLGVDRLVMLLLGRSIRETLAFPFVRPDAR